MDGYKLENLKSELNREKYRKRFRDTLRTTIYAVITVAGFAVLVATLWLPVLHVYGTSMSPGLKAGDVVICSRGGMKRGNVIAFYCSNKILIKRVIGVAGDKISMDSEGNVAVNGKALSEPYVERKQLGKCNIEFPFTVPDNQVFVLADNREKSSDSRNRSVGCVVEENMVGHLILRLWPLSRFGLIK